MKYIQHAGHTEIVPESEFDVEFLKREYSHLWPFRSVCLPKLTLYVPPIKRPIGHANP